MFYVPFGGAILKNDAAAQLRSDLSNTTSKAAFFAAFCKSLAPLGVMDIGYYSISPANLGRNDVIVDTFYVSYIPNFCASGDGKADFGQDLITKRALQGLDTNWNDKAVWSNATAQQSAIQNLAKNAGVVLGYTHVLAKSLFQTTALGIRMDHLTAQEFETDWPRLSASILPMAQGMHGQFTQSYLPRHFGLTRREKEVLSCLAIGFRPEEIADYLAVGYRTVDKYIVSAKEKLSATTRDHAVVRAISLGLLNEPMGDDGCL